MTIRRKLAAGVLALAVVAAPSVAWASADANGCAGGGCTGPADAITCWWPQAPGTQFDAGARARQRADGTWEIPVTTDTYHEGSHCVQVLDGVWVYEADAPAVAFYLKARALEAQGMAEVFGEPVHPTLALGWFIATGRAWCESHESWHSSRDGFFQIIPGTWRRHGGLEFAAVAGDASADDQATVFLRVLDSEGPAAWACMRGQP